MWYESNMESQPLTDLQRGRMSELRRVEISGTLSRHERKELADLIATVECAESAYLRPVTDRIREEHQQLEQGNAEMRELVRRKERLAARLSRILDLATAANDAIDSEAELVLRATAVSYKRGPSQ